MDPNYWRLNIKHGCRQQLCRDYIDPKIIFGRRAGGKPIPKGDSVPRNAGRCGKYSIGDIAFKKVK